MVEDNDEKEEKQDFAFEKCYEKGLEAEEHDQFAIAQDKYLVAYIIEFNNEHYRKALERATEKCQTHKPSGLPEQKNTP